MKLFALDVFVTVECHPYRTALIRNTFFTIDRNSDIGCKIEESLIKAAKVRPDNHVVYTLTHDDGTKIHVMCSDLKIRVGTEIEEREW